MKKLIYALYGATGMLVVIILAYALVFSFPPDKEAVKSVRNAFKFNVKKVQANNFGSLSSAADADARSAAPAGQGGEKGIGGGGSAANSAAPADKMASGIMPYQPVNYRYVYKGKEFSQPQGKMEVLKRIKGAEADLDIADLASGLDIGLVDINSFSGLRVQSMNFIQDQDYGYSLGVFLDEGSVSIYQNWNSWPAGKCGSDTNCYDAQRTKKEDIPADEEMIGIADGFLSAHNIDKTLYGQPAVNGNWLAAYEQAANKSDYYFPESMEVVYPWLFNGKFVYDEYNGIKQGLTVQVHIKSKKAAGIYNLATQEYQGSEYEMETDTQKILAYAERGGGGYAIDNPDMKYTDLELSDPELQYLRYYSYKDGQNLELLIPALYFPITNLPEGQNFNRAGILVPLAKEIMAERMRNEGATPALMKSAR